MALDLLTDNAIIYVLIAWVVILGIAKAIKLEKHGFEIKPYSLTYKNTQVQSALSKMLTRTKRGIRVFADVSVVAGFLMMGFAFWFLLNNLSNFFVEPTEFAELTVLIPGVTLTSVSAILYFLLSIPIVLIMHEGAHGIVATLEKIKIKTGGSFALGALLLTNPIFALVLPEPFLGWFYEAPDGVLIISIMEDSGAEKAGLQANDLIMGVNGVVIVSPFDFQKVDLKPGDTATITVQRDGQQIQLPVEIMPSPDDPERGLIGIIRDNAMSYKPVLNFIEWNPQVSMFLLWLWMISFFIGIINMLPLPILDGGKFIYTIIEKHASEKKINAIMWSIYAFTFIRKIWMVYYLKN